MHVHSVQGIKMQLELVQLEKENTERNKRTARSFLGCCFTHFWLIFSVAETR